MGVSVEIHTTYWQGDHATTRADAGALVARHSLTVNGEEIYPSEWKLEVDGFVTIAIRRGLDDWGYKVPLEAAATMAQDCKDIQEWAKQFGPDDYLIDTNDTWLHLPVSDLVVHCHEAMLVT